MTTIRFRIVAGLGYAIVLGAAALTGCRHADTVTGVPEAVPTPVPTPKPGTPPAYSDLTGDWLGTMEPKGCSGRYAVTAHISQSGNSVQGKLVQTDCIETFGRLDFTGTFEGGMLEGTTSGEFQGTIHGELEGTFLRLRPYTANGFFLGPITLQRK